MSVTVVGSIAFDAVKTPWGQRDRLLGGSAVHFALSASFLADVRVVGPVGDDFGEAEYDVLRARVRALLAHLALQVGLDVGQEDDLRRPGRR